LHFAAGIRVHDHLAGQFMGAGQFARLNQQGAHADLALRRFGQEDAAVRLALGAIAAGSGRASPWSWPSPASTKVAGKQDRERQRAVK
jgi:hypothetical protein